MNLERNSIANQILESCDSTNSLAKQLAEQGYPHGTWVSSRIQKQGKGRLGRTWESPLGNLYLSMVFREIPKQIWTWVPLTVSSAVVRCLRENFSDLDIKMKWPNDLWIENAKLGGVLCEATSKGEISYIVAGLGLNCENSPNQIQRETTNLSRATQKNLSADDIRATILKSILNEIQFLKTKGPLRAQEAYRKWGVLKPGTHVQWGNSQEGRVLGLGPHAELQVICSGEEKLLLAEEVSVKVSIPK